MNLIGGQASDMNRHLAELQSLYELHLTDGQLIEKRTTDIWRSSRMDDH
jgi:hypothetical protein